LHDEHGQLLDGIQQLNHLFFVGGEGLLSLRRL